MFGNIGPWELILILGIALVVFGPGKLPEAGKAIGKAMNEFKKASSGVKEEFQDALAIKDEVKKAGSDFSLANVIKEEEKPVVDVQQPSNV